ncbi:MAG: ABC transporter permease [Ignavibacteriae bacterium]|nr:ABC transporter permease [Ignavibacteriota bacterium]
MKLRYLLKESLRGFNSAKLSTAASVITITLSLILIALYYTLSFNSNKLIKSIKDKVEIEVFINDNLNPDEINNLKEKIKTIGGVKQITLISKEEAFKIFEKEYGREMLDLYESNPLPASFKINLYDEYKSLERINKIKTQLSSIQNVNEIVFPEKNLELIEKNTSGILFINLVILIIITLTSVFLVSNTIRLVIASRKKIIETFKLLGARNSYIMTPFIIEGFLQGLTGGIFASAIIYFLLVVYSTRFSQNEIKLDFLGFEYMGYLTLIGIILGILGSVFSVKRFLKAHIN